MADLVRAEDLDVGTRIRHGGAEVEKIDFNLWLKLGRERDEWLCDRQVNILLDTGATLAESAEEASAPPAAATSG